MLPQALALLNEAPVDDTLTAASDDVAIAEGGSLVALAHTVGSLKAPPQSAAFQMLGRVPGMAYGMHTRWSETESDFEILLARRVRSER